MTKSQETWDTLRAENRALIGKVEKFTCARNVEIALIEDYGRVVEGLTMERDDLQLAFSRCNETKTALQMNLREAHKEREGIAAQNQALRDALYMTHEHGRCYLGVWYDLRHNVFIAATKALALPDTSAEILRARDAKVLRDMADRLHDHYATGGSFTEAVWVIRKAANELEQKK